LAALATASTLLPRHSNATAGEYFKISSWRQPSRDLTLALQTANKQARMDLKKKPWLRPEWILAVLITLAVCALHLYYWLHIGALWRDEVNLIVLSHQHSFADMAKDSFPVLMPLIVRLWFAVGLGGSDIHLRLIGLMVGLGTVAALWVGMWKIRREPPLIGLVLLGLNSTLIFFGDSLRAYGLGSVTAIMLTASAFVFLKQPSGRRAAWLTLYAILSVQVLYHNVVLVAAVCFGAWAVCWRRRDGRAAVQILIVAIVSAASLLPYLHMLSSITSGGPVSLMFRTGATMRRFIWSCQDVFAFPSIQLPERIFGNLGIWGYVYIYVWAGLALMIIICACAGLWRTAGRADLPVSQDAGCATIPQKDFSLFASVTLLFSAVVFPIFFWRAQMPMQSWYLLPFMASAVVCFDGARPAFPGLLRSVFIALVAGTALLSALTTGGLLNRQFSNVKMWANDLEQNAGPHDYILVYPWNWAITFNHYYKGATPWNTVPPLSDHSIHRVDLVLAQMENTNALAPTLEKIAQTLQSRHRVWFLGPASTRLPEPGTPPPASLPPPPLKFWGWSEIPYSGVWGAQTLQFLTDHSRKFQLSKYPSSDVYLTENMDVYVADGWRTNSPGR
jgi:hypothetical protein